MKLPLETISGTIWAGIILTALFALLVNVIPGGMSGGIGLVLALVIVLWLIIGGLLIKPTPPRT